MKKEKKIENTFDKLKSALPYGFSRIVAERLAERGISVTTRLVTYVANGASRNADIEAELLDLIKNPPAKKEKEKSDFEKEIEKVLGEKA